jgi:hypothetical protein
MTVSLDEWLSLAFDQVDARKATTAIGKHRDAREQHSPHAMSYEIVVNPGESLADVLSRVIPTFEYHMRAKHLAPHGSKGVFFSVFVGERLYFLDSMVTLDTWVRMRREQAAEETLLMLPGARRTD